MLDMHYLGHSNLHAESKSCKVRSNQREVCVFRELNGLEDLNHDEKVIDLKSISFHLPKERNIHASPYVRHQKRKVSGKGRVSNHREK